MTEPSFFLHSSVQVLWADASKSKEKSSGAQDGHVVQLKNTCNWKQGNRGGQTPLYPPMFSSSKKNQNPASIKMLELKNFSTTERAITLNFGAAASQMAYLTHCSVQFYKKEQWETLERKFHVAFGIEFPDYTQISGAGPSSYAAGQSNIIPDASTKDADVTMEWSSMAQIPTPPSTQVNLPTANALNVSFDNLLFGDPWSFSSHNLNF
ncbi:uncharacterized protein LACBIDRAFT_335452 [Laccaria bicolor S238N-H82]|uniref:Predicted protein n=1 Tax=Laccaria bicolor (strain S238N-H82 / ATCC MYA-4686) TaxID=486041 RepID=B0E2D0_LACBS|nr:uncharacterized protein LACBIDRAFT_335452 [Laccaria bicolor S238N-H82]EDQ99007.1 predicted protein [Laccaria bicolor S238N-H82]|eukprot:XP_001890344.1 predicted protein [Laccaria bicolor S238N-H82]